MGVVMNTKIYKTWGVGNGSDIYIYIYARGVTDIYIYIRVMPHRKVV